MDNPRFHRIERQMLELPEINTAGWILDIGGGGEGTIGQLCGQRVVAIDLNEHELEDAPGEALKIIMDAGDLKFLNETFDTATAFFSLMFIPLETLPRVFSEVHRVLRLGGSWLIWDVNIPPFPGGEQDIFIVPVSAALPAGQVNDTGYGVLWTKHAQNGADFCRLAAEAGFTIQRFAEVEQHFLIELRKGKPDD